MFLYMYKFLLFYHALSIAQKKKREKLQYFIIKKLLFQFFYLSMRQNNDRHK